VVLYRSRDLRRHQIYTCADWAGYAVVNPTVQSTKSAGPVAAAWAILHFMGDDGYLEIARQVRGATLRLCEGIESIPGLRLLVRPDMNLLAFTSDEMNVFHLVDEMKERGWYVQPQLAFPGSKENIHLSVNPASVRWVEDLLADLRGCASKVRTMPASALDPEIRDALTGLDGARFDDQAFAGMLGMLGLDGTRLPKRMAPVNEVLNLLPAALREKVLGEYLNQLFR
jgi:glutamate/tyrosine decarboxylase-like PLP-dependent enzyme